MKVFVILFAVTIAIHGSSATSADIQNQVNLYVGNAATQIQTSVSNYKAQIGTQANKYYDALNALATRIGNDLKAIGITTIANQINTDVNNLVTNLKNSLNPTSLQTQLQTILTTLSNYQSTVQSYIDQLKAAVDRNSANMVCWNNNAATLKSISDDVLSQTNAAVSNGLVSLNSQIQAIANTINTATTTHENQVKACNGNTACINALLTGPGYTAIKQEYSGYASTAAGAVSGAIKSVTTQIQSSFSTATTRFNSLKATVVACVK